MLILKNLWFFSLLSCLTVILQQCRLLHFLITFNILSCLLLLMEEKQGSFNTFLQPPKTTKERKDWGHAEEMRKKIFKFFWKLNIAFISSKPKAEIPYLSFLVRSKYTKIPKPESPPSITHWFRVREKKKGNDRNSMKCIHSVQMKLQIQH